MLLELTTGHNVNIFYKEFPLCWNILWWDSCWLTVTLSPYNKGGSGTWKVVPFSWRPPHLHMCPPHLQCHSEGLLLKRGPQGPAGFRSTKSVHVFVTLTSSDWLQPLGSSGTAQWCSSPSPLWSLSYRRLVPLSKGGGWGVRDSLHVRPEAG